MASHRMTSQILLSANWKISQRNYAQSQESPERALDEPLPFAISLFKFVNEKKSSHELNNE